MALESLAQAFFTELGLAIGIALVIALVVILTMSIGIGVIIGWFADLDTTAGAIILAAGLILTALTGGLWFFPGVIMIGIGSISIINSG